MTDDAAFLELARLIRAEVARIAADPASHPDLLTEVFERADRDERARLAQRVFDALEPAKQWEVLERLFGDDELRAYLDARRRAHHDLCARARAASALDSRDVPAGEVLVLGLFRDDDVQAAVMRGHRSTAAARRLTLRSLGDGLFQLLGDVFNPDGAYFVTRDYDETTWRDERIESHALVRVGAITHHTFEPVLHPGGRVDLRLEDNDVRGRLFLGFATLSGAGVFAP
ncbi:MAG: hypothetical protein Q8K63_10855 [Acidimicrobiales bacterium]|nr:hypothetical protein [Acidimicrobiales bacterium]